MRKILFPLSILFVGLTSHAQTKLISHRSHSGSDANFLVSLENSLFDLPESNFGLPGPVQIVKLDSVIHLTDTSVVLVKSVYYYEPWGGRENDTLGGELYREVVYKDPLLSQKHSLDSIKQVYLRDYRLYSKRDSISMSITSSDPRYLTFWDSIRLIGNNGYHYENSPESVKFVGFDNEKPKVETKKRRKHKKGFFLPFFSDDDSNSFDSMLWVLVLSALGFAAMVGWKSWRNVKLAD